MNSSVLETASGMFNQLKEMTRSLGLPSLEFIDDGGVTVQMEIRPPSSSDYNVPHCGYRTHLMRLLVNKSLHFFFEVLGQRVSSGSFLPETSSRVDSHIVDDVLDSLNGGVHVCQGRGTVPAELTDPSRRKEAVRKCLVDGNIITYPDYRYRSYDCQFLVDPQNGETQCSPCAQPYDERRRESLPSTLDFSNLRLDNSRSTKEIDSSDPTVVEHHHHHHHHYYREGSSPISFLYQDPNGPAPLSLIE